MTGRINPRFNPQNSATSQAKPTLQISVARCGLRNGTTRNSPRARSATGVPTGAPAAASSRVSLRAGAPLKGGRTGPNGGAGASGTAGSSTVRRRGDRRV